MKRKQVAMDDFDRALLAALQSNNQQTAEELATIVRLSPASCLRRVRRLRKEGIVAADVSLLAPSAFGPRLSMIARVVLERDDLADLEAFHQTLCLAPEVLQAYAVLGEWDYELLLSVVDMDAYETLTRRLFVDNAMVKRYDTALIRRQIKFLPQPSLCDRRRLLKTR